VVAVDGPTAVVLGGLVDRPATGTAPRTRTGAFEGLAAARSAGPDAVVDAVEASQLRGRGGAAYPAGRKWRAVRAAAARSGRDPVVVVNADEGDPGAYVDRWLLQDDPGAVLDGMAVAAHAVGATAAVVYVRAEYPGARRAVAAAIEAAARDGALGDLPVAVVDGHGSYVCGEETALIDAIEGGRPRVHPRPPYPAERGLDGRPTLVHNVETLVAVRWIALHGGPSYAALGQGTSRGTKVVSLSSAFARPGLYEVELGVSVRHIVEDLGGGLADGDLAGVVIGGPLAGVLPASLLDTPLTIDDLRAVGADVGHGGVLAYDTRTPVLELARHVLAFGAAESCGTCTPCRVGTAEAATLLTAALDGIPRSGARARLDDIVDVLAATSLCGHGTGIAAFARSLARHHPTELARCLG
jgi:NADH:ubiquinone oxidoreductase subunit F (NADH-binding)